MATNINTILNWFLTDLKPTQEQFWATFLSFRHKDDPIPQSAISNLTTVLAAKAENDQFNAHKTATDAHQAQFDLKEDKLNKGVVNGYAPLDEFIKVASVYLNIVNDLVTGGIDSLLSAEQGKVLQEQIDGINLILTSDDINLDTVQEIVDAIKEVETSLSTILVNDLTTGGTTKALTAEMGKSLKGMFDGLYSQKQDYLNFKSPQHYGAFADGINDDTAAINQAMLENDNVFLFGNYITTDDLVLKENQNVFSNNAKITRLTTNEEISNNAIIVAPYVGNWSMYGKLTLVGSGKRAGVEKGIYIVAGYNFKVDGLTVKNIAGNGIEITAAAGSRGNRGLLSNISVQNNWTGVKWGYFGEYSTVRNINASGNNTGLIILAGNVTVQGGSITDNDNGIYIGDTLSTNNSHGILQGLNVNHNLGYDLKCENVEYGQTINSCHFYGDEANGGIQLVSSRGVSFNGCVIDGSISDLTPSGVNLLSFCQLEPVFRYEGNTLIFKDCFTKEYGYSDYNNGKAVFSGNLSLGDDFKNPAYNAYEVFSLGSESKTGIIKSTSKLYNSGDGMEFLQASNGEIYLSINGSLVAFKIGIDGTLTLYGSLKAQKIDLSTLGSYPDDSTAAALGVAVGYGYINSLTGAMHRRLT